LRLYYPFLVIPTVSTMKRRLKLFTAGPVACFPEVLEVMSSQMFSHRSSEYMKLHMETIELLMDFFETKQTVLLFPSSGTGLMEASIRNAVSLNGKVLVTIIGAFGERYAKVVESNGRKAIRLTFNPGDPVDEERLKATLEENPDIEAVTITHNETSTGVLNPLPRLAKIIKKYDKLIFVDAVSSAGATEIKFDEWKIDFLFTSSQKALGIPPGLAFAAVSDRVLEIAEKIPHRGYYFDLLLYVKYQKERKGTPTTPPIPQIMGLNVILKKIRDMGKAKWFDMYRRRAEKIRRGVKNLGLEILAKKGFESPTITVVLTPEGIGPLIYEKMREKGFELAKGYGSLKKKSFRIGHMGYITDEDIDEMFEALEKVLKEVGLR